MLLKEWEDRAGVQNKQQVISILRQSTEPLSAARVAFFLFEEEYRAYDAGVKHGESRWQRAKEQARIVLKQLMLDGVVIRSEPRSPFAPGPKYYWKLDPQFQPAADWRSDPRLEGMR